MYKGKDKGGKGKDDSSKGTGDKGASSKGKGASPGHHYTTNSWWAQFHTEDSRWSNRRKERAIAHQEAVRAAEAAGGTYRGSVTKGPDAVGQGCSACEGTRHYALKCKRKLCGKCCARHRDGPCSWHREVVGAPPAAAPAEVETPTSPAEGDSPGVTP